MQTPRIATKMVILRKKTKQKKEKIGGNILVIATETSVINPRG